MVFNNKSSEINTSAIHPLLYTKVKVKVNYQLTFKTEHYRAS